MEDEMDQLERSELVLSFARVLHENGETTGETIEAAERLGKGLALSVQLIPEWGDILLRSKEGDAQVVSTVAASPIGVEMSRVNSAMMAIDRIDTKMLKPTDARGLITSISKAPPAPTWQFALAAAGGAAALAVIFGVEYVLSVLIIMASAGAGAVLRRIIGSYSANPFVQPFCAALLAGVIGAIAVIYNLSSTLRLIAVCPCLVLVPGPHILNGMIDMLRARMSLAIARLVYAGFILVTISAGLLLAFAPFQVSLPVEVTARSVPLLIDVCAAGVAAAAYAIFYSTPVRMIWWPIVVGMISHALRYETLAAGGSIIVASFIGALFVGLVMSPVARLWRIPFAAVGFASVVSMIPGVYVLRMVSGLLELIETSDATRQLLSAVGSDAVYTVAITLALALGLIVPKLILDHYIPIRPDVPKGGHAVG
jgi:uncharacterized membrane protein YjjP (DUF1212 family)